MRGLKISALILILLLFVISGWIYMLGMGMERTFLNPSYYMDIVNSVGIFPDILDIEEAGCSCSDCIEPEQNLPEPDYVENTEEAISFDLDIIKRDAFLTAFHKEWLEAQFFMVVADILAMFKGEQEYISAVIELKDVNEHYRNEIINQIEQSLAEQTDNTGASAEELQLIVDEFVKDSYFPEEFVIAEFMEYILPPVTEEFISNVQLFRENYLYITYFSFVLFFVLICLLAGFPVGLMWYGAAAVFSGVTFVVGLQLFRITVYNSFVDSFFFLDSDILSSAAIYTLPLLSLIPLIFAVFGLVTVIVVLKARLS